MWESDLTKQLLGEGVEQGQLKRVSHGFAPTPSSNWCSSLSYTEQIQALSQAEVEELGEAPIRFR